MTKRRGRNRPDRKLNFRQATARPWFLSLGAAAIACIPALQSSPVGALPASVEKTVAEANRPAAVPAVQRPAKPIVRATPAHQLLETRIRKIGAEFNGDVGIAVQDLQTGWTTDFDGKSLFPQQSVSKFWVALTALDKADREELDLRRQVTLRKSDITLFHQPIAQLIGNNGYSTTLFSLLERALQQSDNTANDFLLWRAGGPSAVRDFLRRKGIENIRFGPGERLMQSQIAGMDWSDSYAGRAFYRARNSVPSSVRRRAFEKYAADPVDGASPLAVVDALGRLKAGELLSPESTQRILAIMSNTKTGPRRLKGGLAPGWRLAHKTGTGQVFQGVQAGYNDIGIVTAPDGRSYAIAVLIRKTSAPIVKRMDMMQDVTRAVVDFHGDISYRYAQQQRANAGNGSD